MDKEQKEREYFLAGIRNLFSLCDRQNAPRFSCFLNETERALAQTVANHFGKDFQVAYDGGYDGAERVIMGVFPPFMEPTGFPLTAYTFHYPALRPITHRDVLGSLMGQQLKRETIGDIVVLPKRVVIFAEEKVEKVLATQIDKIGSAGITVEKGFMPFEHTARFEEIKGTLASLRLDAAVALLTGASREKAAKMVTAGLVQLNHMEKTDGSASLSEGDQLTVRGYGKFKLSTVGGFTRKGRLSVIIQKYL